MATQFLPAHDVLTASSHEVALPYRGDGVAWALRQTYQAQGEPIPPDMLRLLLTIDEPLALSDPG
jgi:hypothetical protein